VVRPSCIRLLVVLLLCGAACANAQDESNSAVAQDGTELTLEQALEVPVPVIEPPPKIWEGRIEAGVNGAAGNTERLNTRLGAHATRKTPSDALTLDFIYAKSTQDGAETENKALFSGRNEWLCGDDPWFLYTYATAEYDAFQAWDVRVTGGLGCGYKWIKNDCTSLATRLGAGFSREIGGPENRFVPELNLGLDFEHKLSERQKFTTTIDVFPDLGEFGEFRSNIKAAWECLIDPVHNLSLQIGVLDRYDSTPEGANRNDIDYFGLLVWKF
jgi:putative salt-induced outer membrane protein YdiY